jgi:signal transduction histidine kinase
MRPSLLGRLMLAYTLVLAAVLLSAWWSERSFSAVEDAAERLSRRSVEGMQLMAELNKLLRERSRLEQHLLIGGGPDAAILDPLDARPTSFRAWFAEMQEFAHSDDERALLSSMQQSYQSFSARAAELSAPRATRDGEQARRVFASLADDVERLLSDSEKLFERTTRDMQDRKGRAETVVSGARRLVIGTTAVGALCSLCLGFVLMRQAARPIYRLVLRLGASGAVDRVEFDGDEIGTLERHVASLLDRVRVQERALQQAEKLSELGEIATEIAHETLNPLTGAKAMLQAVRLARLPADRVMVELQSVERQLNRVEETVRRLVRYARPLEPHMRPTVVSRVLEHAIATARLAPGARERSIELVPPLPECEWVMDPELIEQVLVNLLVNGCEASPAGSRVEIAAKVDGAALQLSVRDCGTGLAKVDRSRLFHPFYTTKPHGNGLGLAISRNIAREHGGQLDAFSLSERGSEFRLVLPERPLACAEPS